MDKSEMSKSGNKFLSSLSAFFRGIADEWLTVRDTKQIAANLKSNMLFLISGIAFAIDQRVNYYVELISSIISIAFIILFASQAGTLREDIKSSSLFTKLFSLLSALGVCCCTIWLDPVFNYIDKDITCICRLIIPTISVYFVYVCMVLFWKKLISIFSENKILSDITKPEMILYTIFMAALCMLAAFAFSSSAAFYEPTLDLDIIYTFDTTEVLSLKNYQTIERSNIRHPMFAVFSSPFVSFIYFISKMFRLTYKAESFFITIAQIPILVISNFMLAKAMHLIIWKRICFMTVTFSTYSCILFSIAAEQYIISYFWISLFIYLICENKRTGTFMTCAAGGTMTTSLAIVPYEIYINSDKKPLTVLKETLKQGILFLIIMLSFNSSKVIMNIVLELMIVSNFLGNRIPFSEKIYQYLISIKNYFVSPETATKMNSSCISWQLAPAEHLNIAGLIILILCAVSFYINRQKRISKISAFWICFSFFVLVIFGWGTAENGLILYSLYFCWAFLVLLFQLAEWVCEKLKCKFILPVFSAGTSAYLLAVNIPAIMDMINFLAENYPPQMQ